MGIQEAREIIRQKPHLIWYSKNYDGFSEEVIVEAVLNYGDWEDVQAVIKALGIGRVAEIFETCAFRQRTNYRPEVQDYFHRYFQKHA